jgi:hypothetical protein
MNPTHSQTHYRDSTHSLYTTRTPAQQLMNGHHTVHQTQPTIAWYTTQQPQQPQTRLPTTRYMKIDPRYHNAAPPLFFSTLYFININNFNIQAEDAIDLELDITTQVYQSPYTSASEDDEDSDQEKMGTTKEEKITVSIRPVTIDACTRGQCLRDEHQRAGVLANNHSGQLSDDMLEKMKHVLIILLTDMSENGDFSCLVEGCDKIKGLSLYGMKSHVASEHGHELGQIPTVAAVQENIRRLLYIRINKNYPNHKLICGYCGDVSSSTTEFYLHRLLFHPPYEDEREVCGDCLALLENTSLAQHISDSHSISCDLCQLDFSRVAGLINHCLRKHTLNFLRTLNDSNRKALFAASKSHAVFLSHENAAPNIPVSSTENKNLPSLFSDDFTNILRGAGFMGNFFTQY